jgi:hypothetical protein
MRAFELNKQGKIVFPSNCFPDLDFSTFESLEQLDASSGGTSLAQNMLSAISSK